MSGAYDGLAGLGYEYGPAFRGLRAMWRRGSEIFAEVAVPEDVALAGFGIHPMLLDAALHALGVADEQAQAVLPFSWQGVCLHAAGASRVRVRLAPAGAGAVSVELADPVGLPVLSVRELALRPVSVAQLSALTGTGAAGLLQVSWTPVALAGNDIDEIRVWQPEQTGSEVVGSVRAATHQALAELQAWLDDEASGMLVVTRGAVALDDSDVTDLAGAAVWGLARSAQAEHPGRVVLVDTDGSLQVEAVIGCGEPQLVVRAGVAYGARLTPASPRPVLELPAGRVAVDRRWCGHAGRCGRAALCADGIGGWAGTGGARRGRGQFPGCVGGVGDVSGGRRTGSRGRRRGSRGRARVWRVWPSATRSWGWWAWWGPRRWWTRDW